MLEIDKPGRLYREDVSRFQQKCNAEPRYEAGSYFEGAVLVQDVNQMEPGKDVVIDTNVPGYLIANLHDLSAGDRYMQAVMNVYT